MVPVVDVVATRSHVEERLTRALTEDESPSSASSALAPGTLAWDDFLARSLAQLVPDRAVAPAEVERLTLAGAVRAVLPAYDAAFTERAGTVDAFSRTLAILRAYGVTTDTLRAAVAHTDDHDDGARARLKVLAAVLDEQNRRLAQSGFLARGDTEATLAEAIEGPAKDRSPESLGMPTTVRLWHLASLPPSRVRFILALTRWLTAHGGAVEAHVVCEPRRMKLPIVIDRALRAFEAEEGASLELQYGLRDPSAPTMDAALGRWVTALAAGARSVEPVGVSKNEARGAIALAEAQGPEEEARWVVARIERWMARGFAPHELAVVLRRADEEVVQTLGRALDDARIPWTDARRAGVLTSPLARALLGLPRVVARGADREEVLRTLAMLQGNASREGEPPTWRVAQCLREMAIESLFDTRLPEAFARAKKRGTSAAVIHAIDALARDLWALAQDGTVAEHVTRLERWIDRAGAEGRFLEESRAVVASAGFDAGAHAILRALARDEAGLAATAELLRDLPGVAKAAGRDGRVSAGEFGEMVLDLARVYALHAGAVERTTVDAVRVIEVERAIGRSFAAVAIPGLHDGGFPARREDEALWGDSERLAVSKAIKVPIERTGTREEETLLLLSAMATARHGIAVSHARHDAGERVLTQSPFFGDLQRTAGVVVEHVGRDPLARSRRVAPRGPERTLRQWAQRKDEEMQGVPPGARETLRSVSTRAEVERARQEFFATPHASGDRYTGRLDHDPELVTRLRLSEWAGLKRPLAVTTLERAARCGFKAFALEVLRIEEVNDVAETIDDKQRGHLLHKLLESGYDALKDTLGEDSEARWQAVLAALDEAGAEFTVHESQVNQSLLEADLRSIRRQVEVWLERRMSDPDAWRMVESEVAFGPRKKWPALEVAMPGGEPVVIQGRIDGVERNGAALRVVEYKSGRGDGFRRRLQDGALDTQFQMVVYAAALEKARRAGVVEGDGATVDGVYVGFRDLSEHGLRDALSKSYKRGPGLDVDDLIAKGATGDGPLGESVRKVVTPLREGRFEPRPRDCDFCQYRSLCRVEHHDEPLDEES